MDEKTLQENIVFKNKIYIWTGRLHIIHKVREALWAHWVAQGQVEDVPTMDMVYNMHRNIACVDRRYMTKKPNEWKAPEKRDK